MGERILRCVRQDAEFYSLTISTSSNTHAADIVGRFPLDTKRLKVTKAANIGLFVSTWWPFASYDRMQVAAFLNVWVRKHQVIVESSFLLT